MGFIVLWAMMGGVVAIIANSKGFKASYWFIYGVITGPIALAHVIVKPAHLRRMLSDPEKRCPDCAESIKADAIVCRYCGNRAFPAPLAEASHSEPSEPSAEDEWFASLNYTPPPPPPKVWQARWWNPNA